MKLFSRCSAGLIAVAACWLAPAVVNAEIVENGGFETGSFFPWLVPPFIPPQQPNPQYFVVGGIAGVGGGHTSDRYAVMSSTQLRFINQLLPTEAGQDYELSFWLRRPSNFPSQFTVRWEGMTVFSQNGVLPDSTNWHQFTVPLHATFNGSLLEFGQATFPLEFHMDDVSVVAVPEPGAAAVFVLGGVVAARRRRR
jgi:hypothetical protein